MDINNISFSYDNKTDRLKSVSTHIPKGKITTIIGPNGCGKSTLLSLLARNSVPRTGKITLDEKDIVDFKPKELARKIAVVHQQNEINMDITVEKLVSFGRLPYKSVFQGATDQDEEAIEWALASTNLVEKRHKQISALSGGERQRVWIALSLAQKTPIIFMDKPTTYLDVYYQLEILELVHRLNRKHGLTIVMVLHDINQAIRYSDHLIVMRSGEIVVEGKPNEIITKEIMKDIYGVDVILKEDKVLGMFMVPIGI